MANEIKKYASLENLQTFKENIDNLYVAKTELEELVSNVAYINVEDNETIENPNIATSNIAVDSFLSTTSTNPVQNKVITQEINQLSKATVKNFGVKAVEIETTVDETVTASVGSESANTASRNNLGAFWQLHTPQAEAFHALAGKRLKSFRISCVTAGKQLTIFGSDKVSTAENYAEMQQETTVLFRIVNSTAGMSTYMLDGSDSRVEFEGDSVIMPTSVGVYATNVDTTLFHYHATSDTNTYGGTPQFSSKSGTGSGGFNSLAFTVVAYTGNTTTEMTSKPFIVLRTADDTEYLVDPETIGMTDEGSGSKYDGLKDKKISFIGDSITTFSGYNPSGYATFYPRGDITTVNQTWWKQLIDKSGMKLHVNAAWSGSTVTSARNSGTSNGTSAAMGASSKRIQDLAVNGVAPDIVIVLIGINDFGDNVMLGDWDADPLPEEGTINIFGDAYALMVSKIITAYPHAEIYCCTLPESPLVYDDNTPNVFPVSFSDGSGNIITLQDYNRMIRRISETMGVNVLDMHSCGLNYFNYTHYYIDGLHPNAAGAELMAKKALAELLAKSRYEH